jgi:hypothetical protein
MPHSDKKAGLRPRKDACSSTSTKFRPEAVLELRTMSSIAALKYGITKKLNRSKSWLYRLLMKEGTTPM